MKKKKNIIKKIEFNKIFKIRFRKSFKHLYKVVSFKYKFFRKVSFFFKSFNKINKVAKYYRYLNLNINKVFIKNRFSYFNFISNGLDLKYDNKIQDLVGLDFIQSFNKKNTILLKNSDLDLIKFQKFISILDKNFVYNNSKNLRIYDYFLASNNLFCINYKHLYTLNYLLLIINCF